MISSYYISIEHDSAYPDERRMIINMTPSIQSKSMYVQNDIHSYTTQKLSWPYVDGFDD